MFIDAVWSALRPLLFRLPAERAHELTLHTLGGVPGISRALLGALCHQPAPSQSLDIGGVTMAGPVGLAAGLDKDALALPIWGALGFGFIEVGTVTPRPQLGNPKPRMFRLPEAGGVINRMGFNNGGVAALSARLREWRDRDLWPTVPVGANIGRNKDTPNDEAERDYLLNVKELVDKVDWFTVNVSSPNTPGLRELQAPERLGRLLTAVVQAATPKPVWLKLAPDLETEDLVGAVEVAIAAGCAGIVATNTTITRPGTTDRLGEKGGLSGAPLWPLARARVSQVVDAAADRIPVIGVGGVRTAAQAAALLTIGCVGVQVYTGLIFEGPGLPGRITKDLAALGPPPPRS